MTKAAQTKRELCVRRISEIYEIAKKAETSGQHKSIFIACYADVAQIVHDFEVAHLKIIQEGAADFEAEDKIRAQFDKMRYWIKALYCTMDGASQPVATGAHSQSQTSKIKLPKISLPQFSGDLALWPSFFALFNTSIHNNAQLSAIEKFQYLLASLTGDVLSIVKNLPLSAEHYSIAYDTLVGRFQNRRKLATHYWHSIINAKSLRADSTDSLRRLLDVFNENVRALNLMEFPTASWDFVLLNALLDKLTPSLREKFEAEHCKSEIPRYEQLTDFLNEYCRVFASLSASTVTAGRTGERTARSYNQAARTESSASSFVTSTGTCPICRGSHHVDKCPGFLRLSAKERYYKVRALHLCLSCLRLGHRMSDCPSVWRCRSCSGSHHTLLHLAPNSDAGTAAASDVSPQTASALSTPVPASSSAEVSSVAVTSISSSKAVVLLSTVRAEIADAHGSFFPVRILLDSASQSNFITESCVRRGRFTRTRDRLVILGLNNVRAATTKGSTSFVIRVRHRDDIRIPIEATILSRITASLPVSRIESTPWKHTQDLPLADPEYYLPGSTDILLGAESFVSLLRDGRHNGKVGEPNALNTIFGWVLMGAVSTPSVQSMHSFVTTFEALDAAVNRFWEIEEISQSAVVSADDRLCENLFVSTTRRDGSGRFVVSYPFAKEAPVSWIRVSSLSIDCARSSVASGRMRHSRNNIALLS